MDFIFRIQNHYFEKGTPWVELDKIKQLSWFLSVDIEDDEVLPCYDTEHELRKIRLKMNLTNLMEFEKEVL
jgi:hypothetical protein